MRVEVVDDAADARLDDYRGLRHRDAPSSPVVVVEGLVAIRVLVASGRPVRSLLLHPRRAATLAGELAGIDAPAYVAEPDVVAAVVGFDLHRGALAVTPRWPDPTWDEVVAPARRLLVVEGVTDLENLGALLRTAAAFGVDGVVLCPRCPDPRSRRAVRVSAGQALRLPCVRPEAWPDALHHLRGDGWVVAALALTPGAVPLPEAHLDRVERLAVLVGAEGPGLSEGALGASDRVVTIPMAAGVDSLNVATASAVAWYAAGPRPLRQGP